MNELCSSCRLRTQRFTACSSLQSQAAVHPDLVADQEVGAVRRQQLQQRLPERAHHLKRCQVQGDLGACLPTEFAQIGTPGAVLSPAAVLAVEPALASR
jgi:hypothetical protein